MFRKVARSLVAGAGAAGALALVNRGLAVGLPINHLPGEERQWAWRGSQLFAVDSGAGDAVLFLHAPGPCGSSYEYRKLFPRVATRHRAIAFDFLGCGLSDKPKLEYTAEIFVDQIADAIAELAGGNAVLVAAGMSAAYAIRVAARPNSGVRGVIAIMPSASAAGGAAATGTILRAPVLGESFYNALVSKRALRRMLASEAYGNPASVDDATVDACYAVAHQPGSRYVASALLGGRLDSDPARDLPFVESPVLFVWGKRSKRNPARNAAEYAALAKRAQVAYFVRSALMPHDEEAAEVAGRIEEFLS